MPLPDPKVTELFLLTHPEVLSASVWIEGSRLLAEVSVEEGSAITPRDLIVACKQELGVRFTPSQVIFSLARKRAA